MFTCSPPMKSRKGLARDAFDTSATHADLVIYDVTDTDSWTQNGRTHGRVFATFKR